MRHNQIYGFDNNCDYGYFCDPSRDHLYKEPIYNRSTVLHEKLQTIPEEHPDIEMDVNIPIYKKIGIIDDTTNMIMYGISAFVGFAFVVSFMNHR